MPDKSDVTDAMKAAKELDEVLPIYPDAVQPAAKEFGEAAKPAGREVGQAITTVAKTVNMALGPLRLMIFAWEQIEPMIRERMEQEFRDKPERVVTPNPVVAGPAVQALQFSAADPTLRQMYLKLLAASMDKEKALRAHPAYVETIRQLTPDEARVVSVLGREENVPTVSLFEARTRQEGQEPLDLPRRFTLLHEIAGCEHPDLIGSYLDNIFRLGLANFTEGNQVPPQNGADYTSLVDAPSVRRAKALAEAENRAVGTKFGFIEITAFGRQFCDTCLPIEEPVSGR